MLLYPPGLAHTNQPILTNVWGTAEEPSLGSGVVPVTYNNKKMAFNVSLIFLTGRSLHALAIMLKLSTVKPLIVNTPD